MNKLLKQYRVKYKNHKDEIKYINVEGRGMAEVLTAFNQTKLGTFLDGVVIDE